MFLLLLLTPFGSIAEEAEPSDSTSGLSRAGFDEPPADAILISKEEYKALRAAGNWFPLTPQTAIKQEAKAEEQDTKDLKLITNYARKKGLALTDLLPPDPPSDDPTVAPSGDGNFLHRITLHDRTEAQVVTFGRRWFLRTVANNIRTFSEKDNQWNIYRALYDGLPESWKTELALPNPASASRMSAGEILALNRSIANPGTAPDIIRDLQAEWRPVLPPPGFLEDCASEIGAGEGSDRSGNCHIQAAGIVASYNWKLKRHITCVKAQANRGTCTGLANVSAIEMAAGKKYEIRVNLSDQAYYNRARLKWDNHNWADGHTTHVGFEGMMKEGFLLYFEDQWNYNPSLYRTANPATMTFQNSCVGYDETCSDTNHQGGLACFGPPAGPLKCGYYSPPNNPDNLGYRVKDVLLIWDQGDPSLSVLLMRAFLAIGKPVVFGHSITRRWDLAWASGFLSYIPNDSIRGGHGVHVVGDISNEDLQAILPDAPPGAGGGYFIVKNSWGNCWGDGGFIYVPYQSAIEYGGGATVLLSVE